jgi:hypothetical protein
VTRRITVQWPDAAPFEPRNGRPIRLLAASDEPDRTLENPSNRARLAPIDGIVGCGDLEPDWLSFLGDAFSVPIAYVLGNHDRGLSWAAAQNIPAPLGSGTTATFAGLRIVALPWPSAGSHGNVRDEGAAWRQSVAAGVRLIFGRRPLLFVSHVPPLGAGDGPDAYHRGFAGYRWLLNRTHPPLWLHGHVTTASVPELRVDVGQTTLVNVTGSVLVEVRPPASP